MSATSRLSVLRASLMGTSVGRWLLVLISLAMLTWGLLSIFDPGEAAEGRVADVVGTWLPDPEGGEAAATELGFSATNGASFTSTLNAAAQQASERSLRVTISREEIRVEQTGGDAMVRKVELQSRPGHHVYAVPVGDAAGEQVGLRVTKRGLIWQGVPMKRISN